MATISEICRALLVLNCEKWAACKPSVTKLIRQLGGLVAVGVSERDAELRKVVMTYEKAVKALKFYRAAGSLPEGFDINDDYMFDWWYEYIRPKILKLRRRLHELFPDLPADLRENLSVSDCEDGEEDGSSE